MTLPNGVTQAQWEVALSNCGLWKPGQRCNGECRRVTVRATGFYKDERGDVQLDTEKYHEPHEKTCPEPTDALLMAMLVKGWQHDPAFLIIVNNKLWHCVSLAAAIILAAAGLRES